MLNLTLERQQEQHQLAMIARLTTLMSAELIA